jgi:urease accessory protein
MRNHFKFLLYSVIGTVSANLLFPHAANAHISAGHTSGFLHGIQHPIGGLDHITAMVAVGLWATQLGGHALWLIPSTFLGAMLLGSGLGHLFGSIPGIEIGILASDFVLGILILAGLRLSPALSLAIVGIFALFHGFAHGAEMPTTVMGLTYGAGFVISTALLHGIGIAIGFGIERSNVLHREGLFQVGGTAVLLAASYVLVSR